MVFFLWFLGFWVSWFLGFLVFLVLRFSWFNLFMLALASFGLALDLVWVAFWRALDLWFGLDLACKLNLVSLGGDTRMIGREVRGRPVKLT